MAFELKDGQGTLFVNDKQGNEKRPDRRGEVNIGGTIYKLSGWLKEGKNGPWLSLSVEVKTDEPRTPTKGADVRDDIPF
jgi:hypothetical protein